MMSDLPHGTVAFLFTDIEGSTRLWERDPAAMWTALDRHHALLRASIDVHGGFAYKTIGDAFQAAFPTARQAVAAAADAQRSLNAEAWDATGPLRVRMAIHLGEATPLGGDYTAPCLNRLARLLGTGFGGQVLLTEVVRRAVEPDLPVGITLIDLGKHRLRDLLEPEQVAQLAIAGLPDHFPPLKSLERHPTNLPIQPTPLVGREAELAAVRGLVTGGETRLVTLTGVGGTGKTRLALQVAADLVESFDDGVFVVDLAPLADAGLVLPTIAQTLGVLESGGRSLHEALIDYLRDKRLLLLLDNFEHLLEAAPLAAELLAACPHLTVLTTSREVLRLQGEREYAVSPLPVPDLRRLDPLEVLAGIDSVELFVQRAGLARPDFTLTATNGRAVAEICVRLDGLPLAIELAAARVKLLEPTALLERLGSRLKLLTGGARDLHARQRTLRATIEWSHDLLTAEERNLFQRLAVFAGSGSIEAAETVCAATGAADLDVLDGVASLIDKSLLRRATGPADEPRFAMLETIREFALERLEEAGGSAITRRAHADWCLALVEAAAPALTGPDQVVWLERLETEHDNMRAALAWDAGQPDAGQPIASRLWQFWLRRGYLSEGRDWLEHALTGTGTPGVVRARVLNGAGALALAQGDYARAAALLEESLTLKRELGDRVGVAGTLNNLGLVAKRQGDDARAAALYEESLALLRELGNRACFPHALYTLGNVAPGLGDYARAAALQEESLALRHELGDRAGVADSLNNLGSVALEQRSYARAADLYQQSLALQSELGNRAGVANALNNLGLVVKGQGDHARAAALYEESLALRRELGDRAGSSKSLGNLGMVARDRGDYARAAALHEERLVLLGELGDRAGIAESLVDLAHLGALTDRLFQAIRLFAAGATLSTSIGQVRSPVDKREDEQRLAVLREQVDEARFATNWAAGEALSWDQAVAFALEVARDMTSLNDPTTSETTPRQRRGDA